MVELSQSLAGLGLYYSTAAQRLTIPPLCVQLKRALKGKGQLQIVWDSTLYHKDDLPFSDLNDMPDVFTPFRNKVPACRA